MNRKNNAMKVRLLSPLYLLSLCISLSLLWCSSPSMRANIRPLLPKSAKRRVFLLRVLSRHAANDLGSTILWFMLVSAAIAAAMLQSPLSGVIGAVVGFVVFTLLPVILPMPSRQMSDFGATGRRLN